ncbi:MAG TPA: tyrosine-type recombinase/integrase [Candidatus Saccharimonadales bacterium]|nr:tyrosine-type recombinase/integrase [Candidatus Saccharimonadales bacterium]
MLINEKDFQSFLTIKQGSASQTVRHCMIRLRVINKWFADKELTKENVEQFFLEYKESGKKNNSLNTYYFVFRQLREYCKDRQLPVEDFLEGFKSFKKTKADIIIFTQEEIERILNTSLTYGKFRGKDCSFLDFRYTTLTMFLAYTGCRYSEAGELRIKRLDLSAGKATFIDTKTNVNRTVFITEPLISRLKILVAGRDQNDYVFRNAIEEQVNVSDYSQDLKKRAIQAGITKRTFPHNFRHSYITHMLEAGVPITEVASLVGHKDIRTTYSTYMHLADKTLQKAAMRHPLVRKNVNPSEIIKTIKEALENFQIESDARFMYSLSETEHGLQFSLQTK